MRQYTVIKAEMELISPGFIGGAIDHKPHGMDPKSIKSSLRYWWRVLNSGQIADGADGADSADSARLLAALHQNEMRLFGEEAKKGAQGQGMVQVVLRQRQAHIAPLPNTLPGIVYLLGQGLYEHKTGVTRSALAPCYFTLELILFHPRPGPQIEQDMQQIQDALLAFGLLGGLGSRQNRGFGSVALRSLTRDAPADLPFPLPPLPTPPANSHDYMTGLGALFSGNASQASALPLLPALSRLARYRVLIPANGQIEVPAKKQDGQIKGTRLVNTPDYWSLLALVGEQFMLERSWGHYDRDRQRHYTNGRMEAEQNYQSDHHLIKAALGDRNYTEESRHSVPLRCVYGLPYYFGKAFGKTQGMDLLLKGQNGNTPTRRGSPFHIHITHFDGHPVAVLYYLPSRFAPHDAQVSMGTLKARDVSKVQFNYTIIDRFLQRFDQHNTTPEASA